LFKLLHILATNKIKYVLINGINIYYDKSPNFVELMLESWFFSLKKYVNKENQINFVNLKNTFQRFERSIRNMSAKNKKNNYVFNRVLALQMRMCHSKMSK
jgi:hypothetical protein